jgi:hypothetical protein
MIDKRERGHRKIAGGMTAWPYRKVSALVICLIGILVGCLVIGPDGLKTILRAHNDFRAFYIGGRLIGSGGLYDETRVLAAQQQTFGEASVHLMMLRLPFYYIFVAPLSLLPYRAASLVWTGGEVLAITLFVILYPWGDRTVLAMVCCWSFPLLWSIAGGQDIAFLLLILAGGLWAFDRQKYVLAGLVLSLCAIKFQFFLLGPLLIFAKLGLRRKWRTVASLLLGLTALLALSFLAAGRAWPGKYLATILSPAVSPSGEIMPNLHGFAANFPTLPFLEIFLSVLVIGMVWFVVRRRKSFEVAMAATLAGGLLLSRHSYVGDCAILIPALFVFVREPVRFAVRWCAFALLLPLPYVFAVVRSSAIIPVTLVLFLLLAATLDSTAEEKPA